MGESSNPGGPVPSQLSELLDKYLEGGQPLTTGRLAALLDAVRHRVELEDIVMFTSDTVYVSAQRLAETLESQLHAAEVVRGARRLDP